MLSKFFSLPATALLLLAGFDLHSAPPDRTAIGARTALDRYVHKEDTNYSWSLANTIKGDGYTRYMINLTSQSWLTTNEVIQSSRSRPT